MGLRLGVEVGFAFNEINPDWANYRHATDSGILQEIYKTRKGRHPSESEISRFRRRFIDLLTQVRSLFVPVKGVPSLLARLDSSAEYRVALATGGWSDPARLKMASAGMSFDDYPSASSDDALDRESIINLSSQRAAERYGPFESMIYVGDGVWDARTCRHLGIPFIGIAKNDHAVRLLKEGAVLVLPDFSDADLFLKQLHKITVRA